MSWTCLCTLVFEHCAKTMGATGTNVKQGAMVRCENICEPGYVDHETRPDFIHEWLHHIWRKSLLADWRSYVYIYIVFSWPSGQQRTSPG